MEDMINPETAKLGTGISLDRGLVVVDIIRSMFDGKMAAIHSGLGHGLEEKFIVMELCFCTSIMLTITYLLCNPKINVIECL